MEADIRVRGNIPPRPSTVKDLSIKEVTDNFGIEESVISNIVTEMKAKVNAPTTGHWPLDRFTHSDWRVQTKNRMRDFQKFAISCFIEETLVPEYRATLLAESPSASMLRSELQTMLSSHANRVNVIDKPKATMKKVKEWRFPDRIVKVKAPETPLADIEEAIMELSSHDSSLNWRVGIKMAMKSILRLPTAALTPRTKDVNPLVKEMVAKLEEVTNHLRSCALRVNLNHFD